MSGSARPVIAQIVETMRALAGSHPGFRPVHAKGSVCSGTFRGAPEARGVSRAPHLQGQISGESKTLQESVKQWITEWERGHQGKWGPYISS